MAARAGGVGQQRGEALHPPVHAHVVDPHTPIRQELLHVPVRQPEAQIPANRQQDHIGREAEATEGGTGERRGRAAAAGYGGSLVGSGVLVGNATVPRQANNRIEADHGRLKGRLRPMRGLNVERTAQVIVAGDAFLQNLRRRHYDLGDLPCNLRVAAAFAELTLVI